MSSHPLPESSLPLDFPGGRVRRLRPADLRAFQDYRCIPEIGRYQSWSPMTDAEATAFLAEMHAAPLFAGGEWTQVGIAEPADTLVGDIGLHLSGDGATGEVGFTLAPSAQGLGLATKAVGCVLELMFGATRVSRVLGVTDARNEPSIRVLERLRFSLREKRDVVFRGEACTELIYQRVR